MEDIICPECGRPNLEEAKKCWYCQTELSMSGQDENPGKTTSPSIAAKVDLTQDPDDNQPETHEDIPEWLARIRKKIEEERGPEEALPYWKQKDIFGGEKKIVTRSSKVKQQNSSEENNNSTDKKDDKDVQDIDLDNLSNDLPDGFNKL